MSTNQTKTLKIASIPGDGIGKEVMPEGHRVLEQAARRFGFELQFTHIEWASCDYYQQHGDMMPDGLEGAARRARRDLLRRGRLARRRCRTTCRCGARC